MHIWKQGPHDARVARPLPDWTKAERDWYPPPTLKEIVVTKEIIDQIHEPELKRILTCVLSSLIVKLSRQKSDSVTRMDAP